MQIWVAFLSLFSLVSASNYFSIKVEPHGIACFFEDLKANERFDFSFEVAAGGNLDIDFWVFLTSF